MDVRCEKCQTEYELDEAKVTEAGVTVKCTACGNLFKIRKRSGESGLNASPSAPAAGESDRLWLIRSPDGELRRFRELTTLQQWIVERRVTRDCEISRTGETWKKLGEIAELASFFLVVEQAQAAVARHQGTRKPTQPFASPGTPPAKPAPVASAFTDPTRKVSINDILPPGAQTQRLEQPLVASLPHPPPPAAEPPPRTPRASPAASQRTTNQPANGSGPLPEPSFSGAAAVSASAVAEEGPRMGRIHTAAAEPAWTAGGKAPRRHSTQEPTLSGAFQDSAFDDDLDLPRRSSGFPKVLAAVVLILGGGAFAGWFFFLRDKGTPAGTPPSGPTVSAPASSAASTAKPPEPATAASTPATSAPASQPLVVSTPPDAAPAAQDVDSLLQKATAKLYDDTDDSFAAADKLLDGVADPRALATLAFVHSTWAQALSDDGDSAGAARHLERADKLAKDAQGKAPQAVETRLALADVARQKRGHASEIEKGIVGLDHPEVLYERGMLRWRDGKNGEAVSFLNQAVEARAKAGGPHLRARYRLALIALAARQSDAARAHLDAILAARPDHARAKALLARLSPTVAVASSAPAQTPTTPTTSMGSAPAPPVPTPTGNYDELVKKGNQMAENANCGEAMRYFEKALDTRPAGYQALTGIGYCQLDRKEFARALASFRAALSISGSYGEALIGMAEAYRFQGMKDDAVSYYRKYLDANPSGGHAAMAKRYVGELVPVQPPPTTPTSSAATQAPPPETPPVPPPDKLPDKPPSDTPASTPAPTPAPAPEKLPDKPATVPEAPISN